MFRHNKDKIEKEANGEGEPVLGDMENKPDQPPPYTLQPASPQVPPNTSHEQATTPTARSSEYLDFSPSLLDLPTVAECITHLKILHAFAKLRRDVGNKDGLFGIKIDLEKYGDVGETVSPVDSVQLTDGLTHGEAVTEEQGDVNDQARLQTLMELVREKRWTIFVTLAVDRFEKWWNTLPVRSRFFPRPIRTTDFDDARRGLSPWEEHVVPSNFTNNSEGVKEFIKSSLPPLDVLMVWHAYMLNPRAYL
jgi:hypothetical protein